ncbi:hypothetical protein [Paraburkholderia sp. HD33-4]|uniref:hypothetical protein n=1 Tax=Paraburkholderia sp. HD33-4 TaxID=2883242 RepID=UPI001F31C270|nr:hypothetical protein [Paraburkholderia sp. HD33-4]
MHPNNFVLKGAGVEVDYTVGGTPGAPSLVYKDGAFERVFAQAQIQSNDTDLGELVSIHLIPSVDAGGQNFGFFLPLLDIASGQSVEFHTVGIYETYSGPFSIPHRPSTWRCIEMRGIAQIVPVPL